MQTLTKGLVVPVSGPEQPPPTGHVGYWTDGTNEVYLGALSQYGVLFFYQYGISDDVVTTNVLDWLRGQNDREWVPQTSCSAISTPSCLIGSLVARRRASSVYVPESSIVRNCSSYGIVT